MRLRHLPSFRRIRRQPLPVVRFTPQALFKSLNSLDFASIQSDRAAPLQVALAALPGWLLRRLPGRFVPNVGEKFP